MRHWRLFYAVPQDAKSAQARISLGAEDFKLYGGEGGIRTHVELPPNGFQDRPVMTTSVPLPDQSSDSLLKKTRDIIPQVVQDMQLHFLRTSIFF
jgi:hypothetical protein